ncbi:MAG: hypothetical protein JSR21_07450 [Proteobacteria bacterium]|nr:hypothetical protein [Pseudomonadota bacterium]
MADKPNFVLVPDDAEPEPAARGEPAPAGGGLLAVLGAAIARLPVVGGALSARMPASPPTQAPGDAVRPRLIFGFDATASREPAWEAARRTTDALARALPGELDVALAVHGGGRLHTFTDFTANPGTLRDRAAAITCVSGPTRMLPILARALAEPGMRVVIYTGDVFEESPGRGRKLADEMGRRGIRLIVLHDVADWTARRDAELFLDLARRTGGCVLPFDAGAPGRLREILAAVAVYAVGGRDLLESKSATMPGALVLLRHLGGAPPS